MRVLSLSGGDEKVFTIIDTSRSLRDEKEKGHVEEREIRESSCSREDDEMLSAAGI